MCGIIAIFDREGSPLLAEAAVKELSSRMTSRGPDHSAVHCRPTYALGHERLSIMDPSPHAHQPLVGASLGVPALDGLAAVVNGEIYNFRALLASPEVAALDAPPVTGSDSEVVLHLARAYGPDPANWVPRLHGMFALVVVDETTGEYVAARDSVGIKPLYMGTTADGRVMFASELKAIHDNCEKVQLFPPGHFYTKAGGFVRFYEPRWDTDDMGGLPPVKDEEVRDSLIEAVRLRMMSDVPYGALLSGGLDSCITCSVMKKLAEEQGIDFHSPGLPKGKLFHTFTVGMGNSPDIMAARAMAKVLGTEHHERIFTPEEALSLIPTIVYRSETYEPELLRSCIPNYFLAELASKYVKMVLTGEGADELFSGYQYFFDAPTDDGGAALQKENRRIFSHLHQANLLRADRMTMSHGLEARVPFLDTTFVDIAMRIDPDRKVIKDGRIEKQMLRDLFSSAEYGLPNALLCRTKAMQCEGVGSNWVEVIQAHCEAQVSDEEFEAAQSKTNPPATKEECYYRRIFDAHFPRMDHFVHVWEGGCRSGGATWQSKRYTRAGLIDPNSVNHELQASV